MNYFYSLQYLQLTDAFGIQPLNHTAPNHHPVLCPLADPSDKLKSENLKKTLFPEMEDLIQLNPQLAPCI